MSATSQTVSLSTVEKLFLHGSNHDTLNYSGENIPIIEVKNIYELGKLVSQRFIEWVRKNPSGVVALPTGRTPEFFIKTLEKYKQHWIEPAVQAELKDSGISGDFPDTSGLHFVMLDEFFPMSSTHRNSFCRYIRTFYVDLLGIKEQNIVTFDLVAEGALSESDLLVFDGRSVDLTLLTRNAIDAAESACKAVLQKAAKYCDAFEERVKALGGIGFFLGGIGPDGHIAFNQENSPLDSKTRLVNFNYPTAAQAAGDLGGIINARGKAAMTIGLSTITANADAVLIIMAAGEGKADVVREAVQGVVHPSRPATVLQGHRGARFYLTEGAASQLTARKCKRLNDAAASACTGFALAHFSGIDCVGGADPAFSSSAPEAYVRVETALYELSLATTKPVHSIGMAEVAAAEERGISFPAFLKDASTLSLMVSCAARRLREKITAGLRASSPKGLNILHTAPHHDDIMLSYHGAMHEMLGRAPAVPDLQAVSDATAASAAASSAAATATIDVAAHTASQRSRTSSGSGSSISRRRNSRDIIALLGEQHSSNLNFFAYLTSGFHSVDDNFIRGLCDSVLQLSAANPNESVITAIVAEGHLSTDYDLVMSQFRAAFSEDDCEMQDFIEKVIFLRKVAEVWGIAGTMAYRLLAAALTERVTWIRDDFLANQKPGDAIPKEMQILKGCMRESEVDRVWALSSMPMNRISHLRSKFYTDDFFTPMPSLEDDAMPMANLILARQPDVLTVAFDPEGTGPDTHYKVLLVVAAGLRLALERDSMQKKNPLVWGYRNVWFEFKPSQATLMIPVSAKDLDLMHRTFMACFTTQKTAQFPSPHYDGPFSAWAAKIQEKQRQMLQVLLGAEYFETHLDNRVRESAGFVFIHAMFADQFLREVEDLKSRLENK